MGDIELAKDKVLMGSERRSMVISEKEKKTTAIHEAGHALVGMLLPNHDPIHKVTIIPRGPALGVTMALPNEDQLSMNKDQALDRIAMALGGRIAEEVVLSQLTSGASNDFKQATKIARAMITQWGMSDKLGPVAYVEREEGGFLGASYHTDYSETTAKEIDVEVRRIITEQYSRVRNLLEANRERLDGITDALLERETIGSAELDAILEGRPLPPSAKIVIPSYSQKRREQDKNKGSIFQPRPREIPSAG